MVAAAVTDGTAVKVVMSRPRSDAPHPRVTARPVSAAGGVKWLLAFRQETSESHANLVPDEAAKRLAELARQYDDVHLHTREEHVIASRNPAGRLKLKRRPAEHAAAEPAPHNREPGSVIPDGTPVPFLVEVGVMTPEGKVRAKHRRKFRQINRYLEMVMDVDSSLPAAGVNVVDFGCGKSYLTFALHHLFSRREPFIVGLDRRADVIATCQGIARRTGASGLSFRTGDIESHVPDARVDMVVSLHACDTATDDALAQAVKWNAPVIFAVPCCQHELATLLAGNTPRALVRHGIVRERTAALVTDALRAAALEAAGYRAEVVEFIDMEHTAKNVLIRATKRKAVRQDAAAEYLELKAHHGLGAIRTDSILEVT